MKRVFVTNESVSSCCGQPSRQCSCGGHDHLEFGEYGGKYSDNPQPYADVHNNRDSDDYRPTPLYHSTPEWTFNNEFEDKAESNGGNGSTVRNSGQKDGYPTPLAHSSPDMVFSNEFDRR